MPDPATSPYPADSYCESCGCWHDGQTCEEFEGLREWARSAQYKARQEVEWSKAEGCEETDELWAGARARARGEGRQYALRRRAIRRPGRSIAPRRPHAVARPRGRERRDAGRRGATRAGPDDDSDPPGEHHAVACAGGRG